MELRHLFGNNLGNMYCCCFGIFFVCFFSTESTGSDVTVQIYRLILAYADHMVYVKRKPVTVTYSDVRQGKTRAVLISYRKARILKLWT